MRRCLKRWTRFVPFLFICGVLGSIIVMTFDPTLEQQEHVHALSWRMTHRGRHEGGPVASAGGPPPSDNGTVPCGTGVTPACGNTTVSEALRNPVDLVLEEPAVERDREATPLLQKVTTAGEEREGDETAVGDSYGGGVAKGLGREDLGFLPQSVLQKDEDAIKPALEKDKDNNIIAADVNNSAIKPDVVNMVADVNNVAIKPDVVNMVADVNNVAIKSDVVNMVADVPDGGVNGGGEGGERSALMFQANGSELGWVPPTNAGENGRALIVDEHMLSGAQKEEMRKGKEVHKFNEFVSSRISVRRSLPDVREPECKQKQYDLDSLPDTSVVIIYHNEAWSTLLRTVHSVLDRSPPQLVKQIILVDDASYLDHLKQPLDDYVSQLEKVTVVRMPSRQGLIQARLEGFARVTAATVVFLDSHCECTPGWLEPLLERIALDPTTVVVPVIEAVDMNTWQYHHSAVRSLHVGTFRWTLLFNWMPVQASEVARRKSDIEPIRTPTMAGGLFAINKDFFYKLGTYDQGMKIWGGENLELSFKIWMCGGTIETIPCSFVGHVFRTVSPHSAGNFHDYLGTNIARLTAVWLDEYSFYVAKATRVREEDRQPGDVSDRLELRRRLMCHSFGWYLMTVMPERYLPADRVAHGPIENAQTGMCVASAGNAVVVETCRSKRRSMVALKWYMNPGQWTVFQSPRDEDEADTTCLDFDGTTISHIRCHGSGGNQLWSYSQVLKQLSHRISGLCLEVSTADSNGLPSASNNNNSNGGIYKLVMSQCDPSRPAQQWEWDSNPVPGPSWRKDLQAGKTVW